MRWRVKIVIGIVVVLIGVFALQIVASESGEVVVLHTALDGRESTTRLWVVDYDGAQWLRTGDPTSGWYDRIAHARSVVVERGEASGNYDAVPDPAMRAAINARMREKYAWRDVVIGWSIGGWEAAIPVRLDPK